MGKLIMWNLMTLDGYVAGPNGDISWHDDVWGDELEQLRNAQCKAADALIFGRVTYELMAGYWPTATGETADFMNGVQKYVFSRTLTKSDWNKVSFFAGDVPATVERLKRDTAKDIFVFGSADLCATIMRHGLFDELRIALCPVLLGAGSPLFRHSGDRARLKLLDAAPMRSNGVVILRYAPATK